MRRALLAFGFVALVAGCRGRRSDADFAANAFRDEKGNVVCPVMGDLIPTAEKATSHEAYGGKEYYFCCQSCEAKFRKEPEKYADGRALPAGGADCGHGTSETGVCQ